MVATSRSLRLANAVAATVFLIGGSLFALGAALAQSGVSPTVCALSTGIANWGTLTGALCFAVAGLMQEFEHPLGPRRRRDQVSAAIGRRTCWRPSP
jgi:hypothetical protein